MGSVATNMLVEDSDSEESISRYCMISLVGGLGLTSSYPILEPNSLRVRKRSAIVSNVMGRIYRGRWRAPNTKERGANIRCQVCGVLGHIT